MYVADGLERIDKQTLETLTCKLLGRERVTLIDWHLLPLHQGADISSQVYRATGVAQDLEEHLAWAMIVKEVHPVPDELGPSGWHYWKREALAYTSGLLNSLPAGLTAPRCLAVEEGRDCARMWFEDIEDQGEKPWPLSTYASVARQLGRFNGAYLTGAHAIPSHPWLSKGWLRGWTEKSAPLIARFPEILKHHSVRRYLHASGTEAYLRLWTERADFLDVLDQLPSTFCHHDVFPRNVFIRRGSNGEDQPVMIDWAFAGSGAVGEELVPLVIASATFCEMELSAMIDLEHLALDSYLEGLQDVGWQGDPRLVRLGYSIAAALRFGPGCAVPALLAVTRPDAEDFVPSVFGISMDEALDRWSEITAHVLRLADEAREIMNTFPMSVSNSDRR